MISPLYEDFDDIEAMEAALREEYRRACGKYGFTLPYETWKAHHERKAEESGFPVW